MNLFFLQAAKQGLTMTGICFKEQATKLWQVRGKKNSIGWVSNGCWLSTPQKSSGRLEKRLAFLPNNPNTVIIMSTKNKLVQQCRPSQLKWPYWSCCWRFVAWLHQLWGGLSRRAWLGRSPNRRLFLPTTTTTTETRQTRSMLVKSVGSS